MFSLCLQFFCASLSEASLEMRADVRQPATPHAHVCVCARLAVSIEVIEFMQISLLLTNKRCSRCGMAWKLVSAGSLSKVINVRPDVA